VDGGSRSFVPLPDVRLTAEVERLPFSPSAREGFRSLGDNTFTVEATDAGGRTASAQVTITRDSDAPIVELLAPETASRGRLATASVSAVDNLAMASVEVRLGTSVICTKSVTPAEAGVHSSLTCSAPIVIPETARPGVTRKWEFEAGARRGARPEWALIRGRI
jgi:hypothetical protein